MKKIAIYCGASKGNDVTYMNEAYQLGKYMAEQGYELINEAYFSGFHA